MATFTSSADLNICWNGLYFVGVAGTVHKFPDDYYEEFLDKFQTAIPGLSVSWPTEASALTTISNSNGSTQIIGGTSTSGTAAWVDGRFSIALLIDGNGSSVSTGFKGFLAAPCNATILSARILGTGTTSGSAVVDIWKDSYANYPPVAGDSICASAKPTISSGVKAQDTTLTGWTKDITAGDIIGFNVDSNSGFTGLSVSLVCKRT